MFGFNFKFFFTIFEVEVILQDEAYGITIWPLNIKFRNFYFVKKAMWILSFH